MRVNTKIPGNFAELFEGRFAVLDPLDAVRCLVLAQGRLERVHSRDDDLLGENIRIGKIVGFFQAFISEPEDVGAGFVAVHRFIH